MYATPHSVVYLDTSSEILSCCMQLRKYVAVNSFPPKKVCEDGTAMLKFVFESTFQNTTPISPLGLGLGDFFKCSEYLWPLGSSPPP